MIKLEDAPPGYYWIKILKGELNNIYYSPNLWKIIRITREVSKNKVLSNIHFPKENNYGKSTCSFKYFIERVADNYEGLIPIEKPE